VNVSSFEGFSMSVLEALAAGCIPTCTDVASLDHDHLVDGVNCMLVAVDETEWLVDIWAQLTPALVEVYSARARASAASLTSQACYERYVAFAGELRDKRALQDWPQDARGALDMQWDIARDNPWTHSRPGWRGAIGAIKRKVFRP
jgi:hypothetical protein